jgi:hypothetical protein
MTPIVEVRDLRVRFTGGRTAYAVMWIAYRGPRCIETDLADRSGIEDLDLQPEGAGGLLHVPQCGPAFGPLARPLVVRRRFMAHNP